MNRKEVMNFMLEAEQLFPVDEWTIDGVRVWSFIRVQLAFRIDDSLNGKKTKSSFKANDVSYSGLNVIWNSIVTKISSKVRFFKQKVVYKLGALRSHKALNNSDAKVLLLNFSHYRTLLGDRWYAKFTDPIVDYLNSKKIHSLTLESTDLIDYQSNRHNEDQIINLNYFINAQKYVTHQPVSNISLKDYDSFLEFAKARIDLKTWNFLNQNNIVSLFNRLLNYKDFFQKILHNNGTKLVFIVNYYEIKGMAMCAACRELGIPAIDLQHGIQGDIHIAYGNWSKLPTTGFETLPSIFWNWDLDQASYIDKWAQYNDHHRSLVGGNIFLQKPKSEAELTGDRYILELETLKQKSTAKKYILFTLQPFEDDFCDRLIELYHKSSQDYKWLFRLHPRQSIDSPIVKALQEKCNVPIAEIESASKCPLNFLLEQIDLHITQFSSVVLEAEFFGINSICLHPNSINLFEKQIDSGIATYISADNSAILDLISNKLNSKSAVVDRDIDYRDRINHLINQYQVV